MSTKIYIHKNFRFGQPEEAILYIDVPENSTVLDVKQILSETWSVPAEKIRVMISGRQLTDEEVCHVHISTVVRK